MSKQNQHTCNGHHMHAGIFTTKSLNISFLFLWDKLCCQNVRNGTVFSSFILFLRSTAKLKYVCHLLFIKRLEMKPFAGFCSMLASMASYACGHFLQQNLLRYHFYFFKINCCQNGRNGTVFF